MDWLAVENLTEVVTAGGAGLKYEEIDGALTGKANSRT